MQESSQAPAFDQARDRSRVHPSKIALFGLFGCGNSGNDGSLEAMLSFLREARPDAELVCICADPKLIGSRHAVQTVPMDWSSALLRPLGYAGKLLLGVPAKMLDLAQTLRCLRGVGLVVVPGTGILDDFSERPWRMPYSILKWCLAARLTGAKIAFVSIGAGPIRHPISRWLMLTAAKMASYRSYRDEISKTFMESIGLDVSGDPVYPDIAFKLATPGGAPAGSLGGRPLTVGVGLMSYSGWYNFSDSSADIYSTYVAKMVRFILWLLDRGHNVRILQGETSDRRAIDDVLAAIRVRESDLAPDRIVAQTTTTLHDLMGEIVKTDLVVATRFHNVVCALKLGRPTLSVSYAKKNDVLLEDMGLGEFCQHVEDLDVDRLIAQFMKLEGQNGKYSDLIQRRVHEYSRLLGQQDGKLISDFL
jgi:polysaccharide pyruvyl transferase WcaK-like protein